MPLILRLFNLLLAGPLLWATKWYARRHPDKYGDGWPQRFGQLPPRRDDRPSVWIHAVSVGEVNATRTLVAEIERSLPDLALVITATTRTGYDTARRIYPDREVCFYPLDFPAAVRRTFDRLRPAIIVLMELEVWPNLLAEAGRRGVPVCIANGRMTEERSMKRFRKPVIRSIARWMFSQLTWIAAQDEDYAARFRALGAPPERVHVVGSLKYDTAPIGDGVDGDHALAEAMGIHVERPLWVAGSTGPDEETVLLDVYKRLLARHARLQLVVVPRKPERFDEVAALIEQRGFACVRRTRRPDGRAAARIRDDDPSPRVFLGDTMGELRKFYSLADVVFVGRTLVPLGGSDMLEVAGLSKPIVVGPHTENFSEAMARLSAAGGVAEVRDGWELESQLDRWLGDPVATAAIGRKARDVVIENRGATQRTAVLIADTVLSGSSR
jgi:3-deoxy-D-manno-octulosonic-acid transferase